MISASLPRNELSQSDSGSKLKSNFSSKIYFTLISVLDPRSLKHLRAILQESEAKLEMKNFKPPSIFVWR